MTRRIERKDGRARAIMVQGTMSGAGKSLIAAGLCRIFAQDGYRVAPFKSQNMSLNSAVTPEGFEIGRAQAMQAQACGIPAEAAMNPILLKPTTDVGSQVVVMGRPLDNMPAREYFRYKKSLVPTVQQAYDSLSRRFDIVVIEGAGSPAEINLKSGDIVNMGMAKMAAAPVLLVGNIDCGGVFAQLIGTEILLDQTERPYLKASVINKFRGDVSLLQPGLDELERRMGVPVAGVVPYTELDLDDEDGFSAMQDGVRAGALLDIAVIRLPHISNFTDFDALRLVDEVGLRYASHAGELGSPDLVILPGTKATLGDLAWLKERGLAQAICTLAQGGTPVLGICGGFQMLGVEIVDTSGVEGGGRAEGLGLLPCRTEFREGKHLTQDEGEACGVGGPLAGLAGAHVRGYQIHMGATTRDGGEAFCTLREKAASGAGVQAAHEDGCAQGNVYGTYLHGVFDSADCTKRLVEGLLERKGITGRKVVVRERDERREAEFDKLADTLRSSLDMDLIYRILEEGI